MHIFIKTIPSLIITLLNHYNIDQKTTSRAIVTFCKNYKASSYISTPAGAKFHGAVEFCDQMGIDYFKEDIFRIFIVTRRQGYQFLENYASSHWLHNKPGHEVPRGCKLLISLEKIQKTEWILQTEGIEAESYS